MVQWVPNQCGTLSGATCGKKPKSGSFRVWFRKENPSFHNQFSNFHAHLGKWGNLKKRLQLTPGSSIELEVTHMYHM